MEMKYSEFISALSDLNSNEVNDNDGNIKLYSDMENKISWNATITTSKEEQDRIINSIDEDFSNRNLMDQLKYEVEFDDNNYFKVSDNKLEGSIDSVRGDLSQYINETKLLGHDEQIMDTVMSNTITVTNETLQKKILELEKQKNSILEVSSEEIVKEIEDNTSSDYIQKLKNGELSKTQIEASLKEVGIYDKRVLQDTSKYLEDKYKDNDVINNVKDNNIKQTKKPKIGIEI